MTTTADIARQRLQAKPGEALVRAVTSKVLDKVFPGGGEKYLERHGDEIAPLILRGNQTAGSTSASGWGAELVQTAVSGFILNLGPMSAASQLLALSLNMGAPRGDEQINVPGVTPVGSAGAFVEELDPLPIVAWDFSAATLRAKKLAAITAITRELAKRSNAEAQVRRLLKESTAILLDSVMFSTNAATDAAPAGLFNGVTPLVSTLSGSEVTVISADLASLVKAVSPVGGDRIAFIASPARALQLSIHAADMRYPVLATNTMSDDQIAAVAVDALAFVIDPMPEIDVSTEALIHMSDAPLEIVSDTGPTTADPVRSLFQTDAIGIRLIMEMDWELRDAAAVALLNGVNW